MADAFPHLTDSQLDRLRPYGEERRLPAGEVVFRSGERYDFMVVLEGTVEVVRDLAEPLGSEEVFGRALAGYFIGEISLLTGQRAFLNARTSEECRILFIPVAQLREVLTSDPELSDLVLGAFLQRRSNLLESAADTLQVVGSRFSPESLHLRQYLARSRVAHQFVDVDDVDVSIEDYGVCPEDLPVLVFGSGEVLRHPSIREVATELGLSTPLEATWGYDVVVIGGGPAGLATAVYAASEGLKTLCVDKVSMGGQAGTSSRIENYLGFPAGVSGAELTGRAQVQAEKFGALMRAPAYVSGLEPKGGKFVVSFEDGSQLVASSVVVATGARYRRLDAEGFDQLEATSVYYAATDMEARLCTDRPVVVVGAGNSAGQGALYLSRTSPVTVLCRRPSLRETMSAYLVDRIEADPRITVLSSSTICQMHGDAVLTSVSVQSPAGVHQVDATALFSFIGAQPSTAWLDGYVDRDAGGFLLTDSSYATSWPGVFAVGDVRAGSVKRVAAAVGEGSSVVRAIHAFLAD